MGPAEGAAMLGEIWKIGDWSVFPAENTLRRDGSEVKVPPRLMDPASRQKITQSPETK